ncbi:hypothetical protein SAMN05444000_1752 [Shimia gijangensis]|uniref:Uncharacterized protein n=1 Tax=Shimia gijangensis TaxID=1470563 RepID=A0A1M6UJQ0_9RHOB|nr:hypothetical protein SAMN05444000_1752 [Shimia gijangensis]
MGRDKRNEQRADRFTTMVRNMMEETNWQALSSPARRAV